MVGFLFTLIELFSPSITVPKLWGKCVQLGYICRG